MNTLKEFYQAYAAWLDAGAPDNKPFSRAVGLCANLTRFADAPDDLRREMIGQFKAAGLDSRYPFGSEVGYYIFYIFAKQHLNPKRIEWVREHCK